MMPALFLGHGNPMNAIGDNPYSRAWAAIGKTLPLLYILGTRQANDKVSFPVEGFDGGSMSMLSVQLG